MVLKLLKLGIVYLGCMISSLVGMQQNNTPIELMSSVEIVEYFTKIKKIILDQDLAVLYKKTTREKYLKDIAVDRLNRLKLCIDKHDVNGIKAALEFERFLLESPKLLEGDDFFSTQQQILFFFTKVGIIANHKKEHSRLCSQFLCDNRIEISRVALESIMGFLENSSLLPIVDQKSILDLIQAYLNSELHVQRLQSIDYLITTLKLYQALLDSNRFKYFYNRAFDQDMSDLNYVIVQNSTFTYSIKQLFSLDIPTFFDATGDKQDLVALLTHDLVNKLKNQGLLKYLGLPEQEDTFFSSLNNSTENYIGVHLSSLDSSDTFLQKAQTDKWFPTFCQQGNNPDHTSDTCPFCQDFLSTIENRQQSLTTPLVQDIAIEQNNNEPEDLTIHWLFGSLSLDNDSWRDRCNLS